MDKGWIKIHRRITENVFLMHDNNAYLVFTKLLLMVGKEKGQWAGGRRQLGELMNLNHRTLYDVLLRLESQQLITIDSNPRYSTVSICNWHKYQQQPNQTIEVIPTTVQPQPNHSPTTAQHSNKKKKENKNIYDDLLKLLNEKTGRSFRTLPNGYKKTLELFSLEEIGKALDNLQQSPWHAERLSELKSDYLLRASTIDDMLNRKQTVPSQTDWLARIKEAST